MCAHCVFQVCQDWEPKVLQEPQAHGASQALQEVREDVILQIASFLQAFHNHPHTDKVHP